MSFAAIKKPKHLGLRDQIYLALREALMSGSFAPGQTITITALADQMKTSAMPVREALRQLVADRALEILPNRSVVVPVLSQESFNEITSLRVHTEGLLAERAAAIISDSEIYRLRQLEERMNQLAAVRELDGYLQSNREFHFTIYRAAESTIYLPTVESLWLRVGPLIKYALNDREFESSAENHKLAIDAVERRDGAQAKRALEQDILAAAGEISNVFNFTTDSEALLADVRTTRR